MFFIEVHQASAGTGALWSSCAFTNDPPVSNVGWGGSAQYDNGSRPSIAIFGTTVVEVHQGQDGVGPLWYRTGTINYSTEQFYWNPNSVQYDYGFSPSVAVDFWSGKGIEVHQASTGVGPLWQHTFTVSGQAT